MNVKLSFLGAAQNVTGSSYLLECDGARILVDCGMYQERDLKDRNRAAFPVPPESIHAVLLTHAHLDHCGLLPKFHREGFKGRVYCTPATADIAKIVMLDSAKLQMEDAEFKKKRHAKEGRTAPYPIGPLYTVEDAERCAACFEPVEYEQTFSPGNGVRVTLHDAGHILGSSMIKAVIRTNGQSRSIVFSGDVGRWNVPILHDPTLFDQADYVVVESTYGNRIHKSDETIQESLVRIINDTRNAGGNLIIPSFAIERTQELLYCLSGLLRQDRIPPLIAFVDSPMAIKVTEVFQRHIELFDKETAALLRQGVHPCDFPGLKMCNSVEESKAINNIRGTAVIIAGSGMCTGGRVKHHLANNIGRPESTILFVGYQASGTLGRLILEGTPEVRILGKTHAVKARVEKINGFSGHADRNELFRWLSGLKQAPRRVYVTHGEPDAANGFAGWLKDQKGWDVHVPSYLEQVQLD